VSIEVAHKYLKDERWYVVRNICGILSDLKDPDLADHITPALEHADPRVEQAALKALIHSRTVRAAPVLAASLPRLAPNVLNEALDELMFLKHPKSVDGLETFVTSVDGNVLSSAKAVQVLANIDDDDALHALGRLLANEHLDNTIRRAALAALSANHAPLAKKLLKDLAKASAQITGEAAFKNAAGAK
jgi:HEAT repeat protein